MKGSLSQPVTSLKGIGSARAAELKNLRITRIRDFFYHFPRDYQDRRKVIPIAEVVPGKTATVRGRVKDARTFRTRGKYMITRITFTDGSGEINGIWFNQPYITNSLKSGKDYCLSGKVEEGNREKHSRREIINPVQEEWEVDRPLHTRRIVPIYPLTEGLSQRRFREFIFRAVNNHAEELQDWLPDKIIEKYDFPELSRAIREIHFSRDREGYFKARQMLIFSEFFLLQLKLQQSKKRIFGSPGISLTADPELTVKFLETLNFELTGAQKKVWHEIARDMEKNRPMRRLLQGDVGSGKTIIAALALLAAFASKRPALYMAPTEILAEQQYLTLKNLYREIPCQVGLLTGSQPEEKKTDRMEALLDGKIDILVGTHALYSGDYRLARPGLIVIDEQHKFGVRQRQKLIAAGNNSDLLVMTATPIPRSMALTLYGELNISTIEELPPGRRPVRTYVRGTESRDKVYDYLARRIGEGERAFVVCPVIEPSREIPELTSCQEMQSYLTDNFIPGKKTAVLHGQKNPEEREAILAKFRSGEIRVLIATTVIEVGVDIPEATMMVIENADRFGLAQLHQLRGRVGRSASPSLCVLIAEPATEEGRRRLEALKSSGDGFVIAERDLEIRGPGEFFGTEQHGLPELKIADLRRDKRLLRLARQEAREIMAVGQGLDFLQRINIDLEELELII